MQTYKNRLMVLKQIEIIDAEFLIKKIWPSKNFAGLNYVKSMGFSDRSYPELTDTSEKDIRKKYIESFPVFKKVDTCAAEFKSFTPYMYSTYQKFSFNSECEQILQTKER